MRHQVRAWALRFTGDDDAADDVAQDVLMNLERRVQRFSGASRFSTWLFAVTRNVALTQRRREERRTELIQRQAVFAAVASESDPDPDAERIGELVLRYFDSRMLEHHERLLKEYTS